ncbi:hypothetical protein [Endozoicomonas numazuensis]|uniref:hypothetical protein n=1 Tax=Endozoicomonas numazuensis TaxID=1137799 RepID=UPI0013771CE2|nr:hypothetical protein [Endozoicomonas numazuensis]
MNFTGLPSGVRQLLQQKASGIVTHDLSDFSLSKILLYHRFCQHRQLRSIV